MLPEDQVIAEGQFNRGWEISADNIVRLRKMLVYITGKKEGGLSAQRIEELMLSYARDGYVPSHDLITRFIKSTDKPSKFRRPDSYIMLTYFIGRLRKEGDKLVAHFDDSLEEFGSYCEQYFEEMSTDGRFRDRYILRYSSRRAARSSGAASELVALINGLALPQNSVFGIAQTVFSSKNARADGPISHFVTYRYGKDPHFIFKSHTTLSSSKSDNTPVLYKNVTRDRFNHARVSSGFALILASKLYLIGNLDEGSALEVVALSNFSSGRKVVGGLIMTPSASGEHLGARIALVRVDSPPEPTDLGRKSYESLKEELAGLSEMIANKLDFSLVRPIFLDSKPITQNLMVEEVAKLLRNEHGVPRLTYEDGSEFNPASSLEYTYNSALREFR
ncbi:MAG TPA: hypothetical protein VGO49_02055 [Bradyrhizobium sp.]|jgi:hypothetical protein|nr:hypothetical protein [Bradyrhizobium sp.]